MIVDKIAIQIESNIGSKTLILRILRIESPKEILIIKKEIIEKIPEMVLSRIPKNNVIPQK